MIDRQRLRNIIGSCDVEDVPDLTDNIAIALCTYFSAHMDRPDPDPESESGWGEWVTTKTNAALSLLASAVLKEVERTTNQPSAAHAFCGPFPEQSEDERTLRFLLALRCGEPGELYGDDGELQLGGFPHPIDFRRDSVQEIRRKLDARGMAKLIEQQRRAADPTDGAL